MKGLSTREIELLDENSSTDLPPHEGTGYYSNKDLELLSGLVSRGLLGKFTCPHCGNAHAAITPLGIEARRLQKLSDGTLLEK